MTDSQSQPTTEQLKARLAELRGAQERATGWGAAVGARHEEIQALEARLRTTDLQAPTLLALEAREAGYKKRIAELEGALQIFVAKDEAMESVLWGKEPDDAQMKITVSLGKYREARAVLKGAS